MQIDHVFGRQSCIPVRPFSEFLDALADDTPWVGVAWKEIVGRWLRKNGEW